jgi:hypothetical protein
MSKKLKRRANPLAELHFIADVPLERAVMHIGNLANDIYAVTLIEVDVNNFNFEIDNTREKSSQSKINGTLQRWQGTETRISATGDVTRTANDLRKILGAFLFIFAVASCVVGGLLILFNASIMGKIAGLMFIALSFYLVGIVSKELQKDAQALAVFRGRDRLLQLVIDTFKSSGEVEAYDTAQIQQSTYEVNKR